MTYIFWQNVVSIHQSAFIKALAEKKDVILVAEQTLDNQRQNEKWEIPSMGKAKIVLTPSNDEMKRLIATPNSCHIFSGINAFPLVFKAFKMAVRYNHRVSVFVEPYEWSGFKGWVRKQMYRVLFSRYGKHIEHLFVTGKMGFECYNKTGFPKNKIYQWGYFTEQEHITNFTEIDSTDRKVRLIYVGRLDENKNILGLLKQCPKFDSNIECFTIVGDGPLKSEIDNIAKLNPKIIIKGRLDNTDAKSVMKDYDYLILPSLYDGWGAVVNEALSAGIRVLCSDACGASILLDGISRGESFSQKNMIDIINKWISIGPLNSKDRSEIYEWSINHISGHMASNYFQNILDEIDFNVPWLQ